MKEKIFNGSIALFMILTGCLTTWYFYRKEKKWKKKRDKKSVKYVVKI